MWFFSNNNKRSTKQHKNEDDNSEDQFPQAPSNLYYYYLSNPRRIHSVGISQPITTSSRHVPVMLYNNPFDQNLMEDNRRSPSTPHRRGTQPTSYTDFELTNKLGNTSSLSASYFASYNMSQQPPSFGAIRSPYRRRKKPSSCLSRLCSHLIFSTVCFIVLALALTLLDIRSILHTPTERSSIDAVEHVINEVENIVMAGPLGLRSKLSPTYQSTTMSDVIGNTTLSNDRITWNSTGTDVDFIPPNSTKDEVLGGSGETQEEQGLSHSGHVLISIDGGNPSTDTDYKTSSFIQKRMIGIHQSTHADEVHEAVKQIDNKNVFHKIHTSHFKSDPFSWHTHKDTMDQETTHEGNFRSETDRSQMYGERLLEGHLKKQHRLDAITKVDNEPMELPHHIVDSEDHRAPYQSSNRNNKKHFQEQLDHSNDHYQPLDQQEEHEYDTPRDIVVQDRLSEELRDTMNQSRSMNNELQPRQSRYGFEGQHVTGYESKPPLVFDHESIDKQDESVPYFKKIPEKHDFSERNRYGFLQKRDNNHNLGKFRKFDDGIEASYKHNEVYDVNGHLNRDPNRDSAVFDQSNVYQAKNLNPTLTFSSEKSKHFDHFDTFYAQLHGLKQSSN